jgi:hypothetical protein
MKKGVLVFAVALALSVPVLYGDIGENFAKGGIGLSGSVSFYNNFYYFLDDTEERSYWSLDVSPELEFYVADRTSLWLAPWLSYESMKYDVDDIYKSLGLGFSVGGKYAFLMDPAAQKGMVFSLGAAVGLGFYPGVADLVAGVQTPDDSMAVYLFLYFIPRLYFFVNDRLAPYVGITPRLGYLLSYRDAAGTKIDYTSEQSVFASITATLGIAWFIPSRNASLSAPRRVR